MIAPNNPTAEKLTSYECGEEPEGSAWIQFNPKFYVIALIFLLFDVEMIFIFPWATVFGSHELIKVDGRWGWFSLVEMFVFMGILILGLVYVWIKGDLDWIKAKPVKPTVDTQIPQLYYDRVNLQQSAFLVKPFTIETSKPNTISEKGTIDVAYATASVSATAKPVSAAATATSPIRKPQFKPAFKKPSNE